MLPCARNTILQLLAIGCALVDTRAAPPAHPESDLERFERGLLEHPVANYYTMFRANDIVGPEALEQRWRQAFEKATDAGKKERWALLLAMRAAPYHGERDLPEAKRWLESAGTGSAAHSYRTVVASMENDHEAVLRNLKAAFETAPHLKLVEQQLQCLERSDGDLQKQSQGLLRRAWENPKTPPEMRVTLAAYLGRSIRDDDEAYRAWLAELEKKFTASPETAWPEAMALSKIYFGARRAGTAWEWLEKSKAAGAPSALYPGERHTIVNSAGGLATTEDWKWLHQHRMKIQPRTGLELLGWVREYRTTDAQSVALMRKHADVVLGCPRDLLSPDHLGSLSAKEQLQAETIEILKRHLKREPDALEARYVLGRLLQLAGQDEESSVILEKFIDDAIAHVNQPITNLELRARTSYYPEVFGLSFPRVGDKPEKKSKQKFFPGEYRSAYPSAAYLNLESHYQTVGDLVLFALESLHKTNAPRFPGNFETWVKQAHPPFFAQFKLAQRVDTHEKQIDLREAERLDLASRVMRRHLAKKTVHAADIAQIFAGSGGDIPPSLAHRLLKIWEEERPGESQRIKMFQLHYLIKDQKFDQAKRILAELRQGENADAGWLAYVSKSLAEAAGDPSIAIPVPVGEAEAIAKRDRDSRFKLWTNYFKSTTDPARPVSLSGATNPLVPVYAHDHLRELLIGPEAKLMPGKLQTVMYSWVMVPIDPALSLFDTGFAYSISMDEFSQLTPERFTETAAAVGGENLTLAMVRAFYDGKPEPEEQFKRLKVIAAKHPDNERVTMAIAAKALSLGRYQDALELAAKVRTTDGDTGWFCGVVKLICAEELGKTAEAKAAARGLVPITYRRNNVEWLADQMVGLGLFREAAALRKPLPFLAR